jgi:zinc D-Ala-D-Ala carboxypeptidase
MNRGKFGLILGFATVLVFGFTQQPSIKQLWSNTKLENELNHATFNQNDSQITKAFLMGKFFAAQDARFGLVPAGMSSKAMYLQKDVIMAFQTMRRAAMLAGIDLKIISGTRNFWEQKAIWERKWTANVNQYGTGADNARHILLYSSMPGSSRHHWGTDLDINSLEPGYFKMGRGLAEITWLRKHAKDYGFCEVYSPRSTGRLAGYEPEAWHWSYIPLSSEYLKAYASTVTVADFTGFYGSNKAAEVRIIEDFVQGVACK